MTHRNSHWWQRTAALSQSTSHIQHNFSEGLLTRRKLLCGWLLWGLQPIPTSRNQSLGEGLPSWCWTPGTCPCEHWKADFRYPQACFPPVSAVKLDELNATCQVLNMPHHERAKWNRKKFMVTITGKSRINSPVEICRLGSKPQY